MKRILIMGASSGIGYAVAEALASRGVKLGLAARRTDKLQALKDKYPDCVTYAAIDVNSEDAPEKMLQLISDMGGMDIYFHVSGIGYDNPGLIPQREVEILQTNVCGFARMVATAFNYFRTRAEGGHIAAITSVAGTKGIGPMSAYSASKKCDQTYLTALRQLARTEKLPITITDIRPGWIETPLLHDGEKYPLQMTLDYALPRVLKTLVSKRSVEYIDWKWGAVCSVWKLLPDCIWTCINPSFAVGK